MYLCPDPDTFAVFPWKNGSTSARLICDIYDPDGTPFMGCPRNTLKKVLVEAAEMGFTMNVGPEAEFFLFKTEEDGYPTLDTNDHAGYFDLSPVDRGEQARRDMVLALKELDFQIEASHHEVAPGQHEIDFKYADALHAADNIATFKFVVRIVAQKHDLHATFMPKPKAGVNGSGMHINMSLSRDGRNIFQDPEGKDGLSREAYYFIGGIMKHIKAITAITNPLVNSYKRLVPGYEAPVYIAWSTTNRSPLIRIPASRGDETRIELRSPDPAANPYLALAVCLRAGLEGIREKIEPPESVNCNIFFMSDEEKSLAGIERLPGTLFEAIEELEKDEFIRNSLGNHVANKYIEAKKEEWNKYCAQITDWEIDEYLYRY